MKKFLLILLLFAYASSTIGATVNLHFCMGKLASTAIGKSQIAKCTKCKAKTKKGCCNNKEQQLKLTAEHKVTESQTLKAFFANAGEPNLRFYSISNPFLALNKIAKNYTTHSPPLLPKCKLCVLYCNFLI